MIKEIQQPITMFDEEWADPYAIVEDENSNTQTQSLCIQQPQNPQKNQQQDHRSELAKILENNYTPPIEIDFKNIQIRVRDLYGKGVVPFDFSTPSPDDLWRSKKKQVIIRKK